MEKVLIRFATKKDQVNLNLQSLINRVSLVKIKVVPQLSSIIKIERVQIVCIKKQCLGKR